MCEINDFDFDFRIAQIIMVIVAVGVLLGYALQVKCQ